MCVLLTGVLWKFEKNIEKQAVGRPMGGGCPWVGATQRYRTKKVILPVFLRGFWGLIAHFAYMALVGSGAACRRPSEPMAIPQNKLGI